MYKQPSVYSLNERVPHVHRLVSRQRRNLKPNNTRLIELAGFVFYTTRFSLRTTVSPWANIVFLVRASINDWTGTPTKCATLVTLVRSGISVASKLSENESTVSGFPKNIHARKVCDDGNLLWQPCILCSRCVVGQPRVSVFPRFLDRKITTLSSPTLCRKIRQNHRVLRTWYFRPETQSIRNVYVCWNHSAFSVRIISAPLSGICTAMRRKALIFLCLRPTVRPADNKICDNFVRRVTERRYAIFRVNIVQSWLLRSPHCCWSVYRCTSRTSKNCHFLWFWRYQKLQK